jgi:PAS domain S-box-containing protein
MDLTIIPGVSRFIAGETGVFEYNGLNGEEVIGAVTSIPLTNWGVIVEEPVRVAFKDLRLLSKMFFGIFLVTILLAIFLGLFFSFKLILKPVTHLEEEVESISTGDFDRKILMEGPDELGRLAHHLNLMTDTLKSTMVSRNRLIEEMEERKKVEATLQKSEATLKGIFRAAPIGIGLIKNRTMHWINDFMCEMTGYLYGELAFQSARMLYLTDEEFERVGAVKQQELSEKGTGSVETRWKRKDGRIIDVFLCWARIHSGDASAGDTFTAMDITGKKQAEKEKLKLESRLQQAQKMEAIGTLAGGIAHDFNNILGIILGNAELALEDIPKWHPGRRNLEEIRTASLRAKDVVRQLLSFARKSDHRLQVFHIIPVIEETLALLRSSLPSSIEIRKNIPPVADKIVGDPTQIHQIMINLASNAAHAMPDGGVMEVIINNIVNHQAASGPFSDLEPGEYIQLEVSDTGQGIDPAIINRIFDPYFTTKETGKGTGMGLAVVHGIVSDHGGKIHVESAPGKGSVFRILFPVSKEESVIETKPKTPFPTGSERILLVDDEHSVLEIATAVLKKLGYQVHSESSPLAALESFRSNPRAFDLVVSDMTMPHMTGDHLAREIHSIRSDIPVIICTGYSERISKENARDLGIQGYLEKPLDLHRFAVTVRQVLDRKHF